MATGRWGRTGGSPEEAWYLAWLRTRDVLALAHEASSALAHPGDDGPAQLRGSGAAGAGARGAVAHERGLARFAAIADTLAAQRPQLPVRLGDQAALVRLLWWAWSALGLHISELRRLVADPLVVRREDEPAPSGATLGRLMWRSGFDPPMRGTARAGLAQLTAALDGLDAFDERGPRAWERAAVERCRLIEPGLLGLVAMLDHLADAPLTGTDLCAGHEFLAPVALAQACATPSRVRTVIAAGVACGLLREAPAGAVALTAPAKLALGETLTDVERRFGAEAAVAAIEGMFPERTYRPESWPAARLLRAHAYAAAAASEALDVGEGWRAPLLERLCILEREHGRIDEAVAAGARALAAATRARADDDELADILVNYAEALALAGRDADSAACFDRALALDQHPAEQAATRNIRAACLRRQGRTDDAIAEHEAALAAIEGLDEALLRAEILHDLALALASTRRHAAALQALERAEAGAPAPSEVRILVAIRIVVTLTKLDRPDEALRRADRVVEQARELYGARAWPFVNALHARGCALDAIAARDDDDDLRRVAARDYHDYRRIREDLEAHPDDAPGLSHEI